MISCVLLGIKVLFVFIQFRIVFSFSHTLHQFFFEHFLFFVISGHVSFVIFFPFFQVPVYYHWIRSVTMFLQIHCVHPLTFIIQPGSKSIPGLI